MNILNMASSLILSQGRGLNLPNTKTVSSQSNNDEKKGEELIKSTFDLLERGEKEIKLDDKYKDVTLILGNTGSGKSTFTQWVAGDNTKLISVETKEGTGEYIIVDNNRIGNTTLKSKTIFPELVVDTKTNTAYYDCPGFSDTQGTDHDIASTYFIKKVIDFSESIKMIFLISHPSVRKGVDRQEFMKLLRHFADLVKDVEKFKHSVALIATKVDNQYIKQGQNFILVEDEKVISAIADFLQEAKQYLVENSKSPKVSDKEQQFFKRAIMFIDILLENDSNHYPKIGLFRRPDAPGPISGIPLLQNSKKDIKNILYGNLNFTTKNNEDFGYTVSEKTKNDINDIVEEINKNLWSSLSAIAGKIQDFYRTLVEQIRCKISLINSEANTISVDSSEVKFLWQKFINGQSITSDLVIKMKNLTNPIELTVIINNTCSQLDINIPEDDVLFIKNQGKYYNFLQVVSDNALSFKPWDYLFKDLETFASGSKIIILHDVDLAVVTVNNDIRTILNDTMQSMYLEYTEKIKLIEIQKLPEILNQNNQLITDLTEELKNGTTEKLMDTIHYISNHLGVSSSKENLQKIANRGGNLSLLEFIINGTIVGRPMTWLSPFQTVANYFHESGKWYTFLENLYLKFSKYDMQKERDKYNVADLEDWGQPGKPLGIAVTPSTFKQFLNKIENFNLMEYETIKNMTSTTDLQIEELNQILSLTLKHRSAVRCSENHIIVKGDYVSLNETMQSLINNSNTNNSCKNFRSDFSERKYILFKVYALNKIFIDTDLLFSGKGISVFLVAPIWEVIGSRSINLNGEDGAPYSPSKAKNGVDRGNAGENGAPGKPGRSGESFFGIGSVFMEGRNLKITSNGGKGGPGQDGGNGAPVVPGRDAYTPYNDDPPCNDGYVRGFKCEGIRKKEGGRQVFFILVFVDTYWSCEEKPFNIFGVPCSKGGNGGNGGVGGKGGNQGVIDLLELSQTSMITKLSMKGKEGNIGEGGNGSGESKNGDSIIAHWEHCDPKAILALFGVKAYSKWKWKDSIKNNGRCPATANGQNGENHVDIQPPRPANGIHALPFQINEYKTYLRENINNRFKKYALLQFLDQLNNQNDVRQVYNILGLIDEFHGLEVQHLNLRYQVDFSPFYSSLLDRITDFAKKHHNEPDSAENKKALNYLYTAALGRLYNLKEKSETYLVLDILGYLSLVKDNIKTLKDLQNINNKIDVINKCKENYKKDIDNKIEEAKYFISKQIMHEIDNISKKMNEDMDTLIAETTFLERQAEKQRRKLEEKEEEWQNALVAKGIFNLFHIIGGIVSLFGPIGEIAGAVIETASSVSEYLALSDYRKTLNLPSDVVSNIRPLRDQSKMMRNQKMTNLNKLLDIVSEEIKKNPEKLSDMAGKIADIKDKLKRAGEKKFDFQRVKQLEEELKQELKRKSDYLKILPSDQKSVDALKIVGKLAQIAQFGSLLLNMYNSFKAGEEELKTVTNALESIKDQIKNLEEYEESIYSTMVPMLHEMEADMKDIEDKLGNKSQVALEVTKWKVQSTLKDLRLQMLHLTERFKVKDDLSRNIEKMDEAMTTLIDIYERIQIFQLQQNQANYIADISSVAATSIDIKDELAIPINKLESVIKTSIVLSQYKSALDGFKKWVFPFADRYSQNFLLPSELELDKDIQNSFQNAVKGIETINKELVLYKTTLRKKDQYLENEYFNSQHLSTRPFFVWKNEEYGQLIANLLSGKEVVLKSDVQDSAPHKDAIKFSEIEFYFKTKNETAQSILLETLKGFDIRATHIGNSYYRYDNKISLITSDSVTISYSFEKNDDGLPLRSNKDYDQLKAGDFLLSPYTSWEVRVINKTNIYSFHDLEHFKNEINIELSGFGHYVDTNDYRVAAYHATPVQNSTDEPNFNSHSTYVNECMKSKSRSARSAKENVINGDAVTNGSSTRVSSPLNFLCNFLKNYILTNAMTSFNRVFFGDHKSIRNHNDCSKLIHKSTGMEKLDSAMSPSSTSEVTLKDGVTSSKADPSEEINNANFNAILSDKFDGDRSFSKSFILSGQENESSAHSVQVPNLNSSLLLADLVTRTVMDNKYKPAIDKSFLSPRELILRKIAESMIGNDRDFKQNLQRLLSEKEDARPISWYSKLNAYAKSALQFFGFAGNDNTEEYLQHVRNLYD